MLTQGVKILPALIIQLARMGDLLQSLPVITALREREPDRALDILCSFQLISLAKTFPGVGRVIPWNGHDWHNLTRNAGDECRELLERATCRLSELADLPYPVAYNLNNHPRSILAAHLFSQHVVGPGDRGPLHPIHPPWVNYLRQIAQCRGDNRIHLADAFCGLCGVKPPQTVPCIQSDINERSEDLQRLIEDTSTKIAVILGAGDRERRVPLSVWRELIDQCADRFPNTYCVLIGGHGERELSLILEDQVSVYHRSRVVNCVGQTTLPQLTDIFRHCEWVVGSDTGPLHLAVACGVRAIGWYFSRARVHETGPYGVGPYVWQYQEGWDSGGHQESRFLSQPVTPSSWPVQETIELMDHNPVPPQLSEWSLWNSHRDEWGMYYSHDGVMDDAVSRRKDIWLRLSTKISYKPGLQDSENMVAGALS